MIQNLVYKHIRSFLPELFTHELPVNLETPKNPKLWDIALACFPFAKHYKISPQEIASDFEAKINQNQNDIIAKAHGPYLNFFVNDSALWKLFGDHTITKKQKNGTKTMIEYSSPNTNKPMHLGHVRNNTLGMAIANILDYMGETIVKTNLYNDRGIAICKAMLSYTYYGNNETPQSLWVKGDHFVGDFYVRYKTLEEAYGQERIQNEASEMLRKWEAWDKDVCKLWEQMTNWVLDGYKQTYENYGCGFDAFYAESKTYLDGKKAVEEGLSKNVFGKKENGAVFADLSPYNLDEKILMRGDGTSIYITQDLGTTLQKFEDHNLDKHIWVVANEQEYHFKVLKALLDTLGHKETGQNSHHLSYGYISLPNGRMKSREGTVIDADGLYNEVWDLAKEAIVNRDMPNKDEAAHIVAIAAIKFYILLINAPSDFIYNPEESIRFEGKTGPYLLYAYARIQSIFQKMNTQISDIPTPDTKNPQLNEAEKLLIKQCLAFDDATNKAKEKLDPSELAKYLYELAGLIHGFYRDCPIAKEPDPQKQTVRLHIAQKGAKTLQHGLQLLGIETIDNM